MKTSEKGISIIKKHEGFMKSPYLDPVGIWTCAYGHVLYDKYSGSRLEGVNNTNKVKEQYPQYFNMSELQATELLKTDLVKYEGIVKKKVSVKLNQNQFDALVSHTYNTGGSDTLFSYINSKKEKSVIYNWFVSTYITAKGIKLSGLVKRRKEEADLFFA